MGTWVRGHLAHDPRAPYRLMAVAAPLGQYGYCFDLDQIRWVSEGRHDEQRAGGQCGSPSACRRSRAIAYLHRACRCREIRSAGRAASSITSIVARRFEVDTEPIIHWPIGDRHQDGSYIDVVARTSAGRGALWRATMRPPFQMLDREGIR